MLTEKVPNVNCHSNISKVFYILVVNSFVCGFSFKNTQKKEIGITDYPCLNKGRIKNYAIVRWKSRWIVHNNDTFYANNGTTTFIIDYIPFKTKQISQIIVKMDHFILDGRANVNPTVFHWIVKVECFILTSTYFLFISQYKSVIRPYSLYFRVRYVYIWDWNAFIHSFPSPYTGQLFGQTFISYVRSFLRIS